MNFELISLDVDDFLTCGWEEAFNACESKRCPYIGLQFGSAASEAEKQGNLKRETALLVLNHLCSLMFRIEDRHDPFHVQQAREIILIYRNQLIEFCGKIDCEEIKSRIYDLLFMYTSPRHYPSSQHAIISYIKTVVDMFESDDNLYISERLSRALDLSLMTNKIDKVNEIQQLIDELLEKSINADADALCLRLLHVLGRYGCDNPDKYYNIAGDIGSKLLKKKNFIAADFFKKQNIFSKIAKSDAYRKESLCNLADAYIVRADIADSAMARSSWIEQAILSLREVGDQQERIAFLKEELVRVQGNIGDELSQISTGPIDISESILRATSFVQGKEWPQVMLYFAKVAEIASVNQLEEFAKSTAEKCVISFFGSGRCVDARGRTVAKCFSGFENPDLALMEIMYQQASLVRHIDVAGLISPAIDAIICEHPCLTEDFLLFLRGNPYIRKGRDRIIAKGISAGMHGDFVVAYHILVPQLEEILRVILENHSTLPFNLGVDSIQSDWTLGKCLDHSEIEIELGSDIVWMLRCLLTDKMGVNGRNLMAHGLMEEDHFYTSDVIYFYWLFIHILSLPIVRALCEANNQKNK